MDGLQIGRMVHYVMADGQHRPAIVVQLMENGVLLHVFVSPFDQYKPNEKMAVQYADPPKNCTWHYPEKDNA